MFFSHTCMTELKSSLLHNFQYKFFLIYVDTGASINLIAKPHLKHLNYVSLAPQKLRISGINTTTAMQEYERISLTLCPNTQYEQRASFYVVPKIGTQNPTRKKDIDLIKKIYSFSEEEMEKIYTHFKPKYIQILIGTPVSSLFFREIFPNQIGKHQPPSCPNLRLYETPLMKNKTILGGEMGINIELTPSFLMVHKAYFRKLKNTKDPPQNEEILLTKADHISLEDFLKLEENKNSPKLLCPFHSSAKCVECNKLNNQDSLRDIENRQIIEQNLKAVKLSNGKFKLIQTLD